MAEALRQNQTINATAAGLDAEAIMRALADFANGQMPVCQGFKFTALPSSMSLLDAPTYAVQLHDADGNLAVTYKYNYFREDTPDGVQWSLYPLVIQWEGGKTPTYRQPDMDAAIIDHCLSSLRTFFADDLKTGRADITMASGYLTVQRHGHAFFERMGWTLYNFEKKDGAYPSLAAHSAVVQSMAQRIDDISMPFRTEKVEADMLSFAVMVI